MAGVSVVKVAMAGTAMGKVTVIEITMIESAVTKVSAVRHERVMVEECSTVMPVVAPVAPSPPKASEVPDSKSKAERESDAAPKNPGHRIPAGVRDDWRAIHQPRIIGRHVDNLRISRLDGDCASLRSYLFLFVAAQVTGFLGLLTHLLDGIGHIFRLVGIRLTQ